MQQNDDIMKLCKDVLDYGDLLIIANKGIGKTEALKMLGRTFKGIENVRVFIFEDFPKLIHEFDSVAYMVIQDKDVVETQHTIDIENYWLRHERDYTVRRGSQIKEFLEKCKHGIFLMQIKDIERSAFFIYSIVQYFYRKSYLRAYKNYSKHEHIVFIIEESQNVFDSSTISKKLFNRMRKIFSVARNLGLHFVLASQRLQDLNTKIRGRTRLMVGRISLDDYELKIHRLLRHSKHKKDVLSLPKGVFLYTPLDTLISFPKFKQDGVPFQFKATPTPKPKKKGFLGRLIEVLTTSSKKYVKDVEDREEEEDLDEFEEEMTEEIDTVYGSEDEFQPL